MRAIAVLVLSAACARRPPPSPTPPPSALAPEGPLCRTDPLAFGGEWFEAADGTRLWTALEGPADAPVVLFLHGGPGSSSLTFRRAVGPALSAHVRMLYVDQRGCGRSHELGPNAPLGMAATVADLEALRRHHGIETLHVVGHSFGGVVALALERAHPDTTGRIVLLDTLSDVDAALTHQVESLAERAPTVWPDRAAAVAEVAGGAGSAFDRLGALYGVLGRQDLQGELHFADAAAQTRLEAWEAELGSCTRREVVETYAAEGWLGPPPVPPSDLGGDAVVLACDRSEVIGADNIAAAAAAWGAPVRHLPNSGHFPWMEVDADRLVEEILTAVGVPP